MTDKNKSSAKANGNGDEKSVLDGATPEQIAAALATLSDEEKAEAINYAAQATAEAAGKKELDPNKPMWHLVPPSTMQDVLEILKGLPYEKVHRVMPALMQAPLHQ